MEDSVAGTCLPDLPSQCMGYRGWSGVQSLKPPIFREPYPAVSALSLWDLGNQALRRVPGAHVPMDVATLLTKGCRVEASHWGPKPDLSVCG